MYVFTDQEEVAITIRLTFRFAAVLRDEPTPILDQCMADRYHATDPNISPPLQSVPSIPATDAEQLLLSEPL